MSFTNLPLDLILSILKHVTIHDVISIRGTCSTLYKATYERSVWFQIVDDLCKAYCPVEGSYGLVNMNQHDLQATALRSLQFTDRFAEAAKSEHSLCSRKAFKLARSLMENYLPSDFSSLVGDSLPWHGFGSSNLLSGGRFLVTSYRQALLNIWDLVEAFGNPEEEPTPAASLLMVEATDETFHRWTFDMEGACVGTDNKTLRIIVHAYIESEAGEYTDSEIRVYESDLTESHKTLCLVSTRPLFARVTAFDGDRLVMAAWRLPRERDSIVVWDLNLDSSIAWELDDPGTITTRVGITGDCVLMQQNWSLKGFRAYAIPHISFFEPGTHTDMPAAMITSRLLEGLSSDLLEGLEGAMFQIAQPPVTRQASEPAIMLSRSRPLSGRGKTGTCTRAFAVLPPAGDLADLQVYTVPSTIIYHPEGDLNGWKVPRGYFFRGKGLEAHAIVWTEEIGDIRTVKMHLSRKPHDADTNTFEWLRVGNEKATEEHVQLATFMDFSVEGIQFCFGFSWRRSSDISILTLKVGPFEDAMYRLQG